MPRALLLIRTLSQRSASSSSHSIFTAATTTAAKQEQQLFVRRLVISFRQHSNKKGLTTEECSIKFVDPSVQCILKSLAHPDPYVTLEDSHKLKTPRKVTLMSDEQLLEAKEEALVQAEQNMQMPPVLPARQEVDKVLSEDPQIQGFSKSKFVFTDISTGLHERERTIVVREPDGTLRLAPWDVRDRISQVYYPIRGRNIIPPLLFEPSNVKRLLEKQSYRYILDVACIQFEPDHPQYVEVCQQVYDHCDANGAYEKLRSTRHYGPMIFYFICQKQLGSLFNSYILGSRVDDCLDVIKLFHLMWNVSTMPSNEPAKDSSVKIKVQHILEFLKAEGMHSYDIEMELQVFLDQQAELSKEQNTLSSSSASNVNNSLSHSVDSSNSDSDSSDNSDNSDSDSSDNSDNSDSDSSDNSDGSDSSSSDSDNEHKVK